MAELYRRKFDSIQWLLDVGAELHTRIPSRRTDFECFAVLGGTACDLICIRFFELLSYLVWVHSGYTWAGETVGNFIEQIQGYRKVLDHHGSSEPATQAVDTEFKLNRFGGRLDKDRIDDESSPVYRAVFSIHTAWFSGVLDHLSRARGVDLQATLQGYDRSDLIRFSYVFSDQSPQERLSLLPSDGADRLAKVFNDGLQKSGQVAPCPMGIVESMLGQLYHTGQLQLFHSGQSQLQA
ncbi:hypothetical protein DL769_003667 [Monosporascus sp. CRB-8-3]|nr:hypothetical protein DL769_003667 [Monosporascus sp. CRB-8-3]